MNFVILVQTLVTVMGALVLGWFYALYYAYSFALGSGLLILSFFLLGVGYGLIFRKKMIALAVSIIVFKYAILGIIIFTLSKQEWFDPLWFCIGVASFLIAAVSYAFKEAHKEGKANGSI